MCFTSANSDETVEVLKLSVLGWSLTEGRLDRYLIKDVDMQRQFQVQAAPLPRSDKPRMDRLEAESSEELDLLEDILDRPRPSAIPVRQPAAATAAADHVAAVDDVNDVHNLPSEDIIILEEEFDPLEVLRAQEEECAQEALPLDEELHDQNEEEELLAQLDHNVPGNPGEAGAVNVEEEIQLGMLGLDAAPHANISSLPIVDVGSWHFRTRNNNEDVGRLHLVGQSTIKATCKIHKQCICMISMPTHGTARHSSVVSRMGREPVMVDIEQDLVHWLAAGVGSDAANHNEVGRSLRSEKWFVK
ncbi:unnamed protein product, partial [Symbiodinium sp. CCMP2592]